mmetsp:Transcript_16527/g.55803  ORF Transcript_16527/g.55803 Transcript_16527/m.55803 type:complete len:206 (-) Transcript_16527:111-728(-)
MGSSLPNMGSWGRIWGSIRQLRLWGYCSCQMRQALRRRALRRRTLMWLTRWTTRFMRRLSAWSTRRLRILRLRAARPARRSRERSRPCAFRPTRWRWRCSPATRVSARRRSALATPKACRCRKRRSSRRSTFAAQSTCAALMNFIRVESRSLNAGRSDLEGGNVIFVMCSRFEHEGLTLIENPTRPEYTASAPGPHPFSRFLRGD